MVAAVAAWSRTIAVSLYRTNARRGSTARTRNPVVGEVGMMSPTSIARYPGRILTALLPPMSSWS